jgi:hypothetical protein
MLLSVSISQAQVVPGTINAKVDDGVGNKITSTVVGPSRGLDTNCLNCAGGGGGTSSTFGAAFPATGTAIGLSDGVNMRPGFAVDADTGAGTTFVQGFNALFRGVGGPVEAGTALNPWNVVGTVAVSNAFLLDATFTGRINTLGQKTMANSTPVVLASDQASIPVSATVSNAFLLDATFTGRFPVVYTDADGVANQTTTAIHGQAYFYNGVTWDRMRGTIAGGLLVNVSNASLAVTGSLGRTWTLASGTDSVAAVQSGTWNIGTLTSITNPVAVTNAGLTNIDVTLSSRFGTLGQKTMAGSAPVVISSDQTAIPVTLTSTTITGTVTVQGAKTNNNAAPGATNIGTLPCIANAAAPSYTEGNQVGCSENLNGATRTIEQNFVATANNDGSCASGAVSFTAIASNASRTWLAVWASPANTDDVYLKLGAVATNADARFAPGQPLNFTAGRIYTGIIDVFPNSGTQAVCVMELN